MEGNAIMQCPIDLWDLLLLKMMVPQETLVVVLTRVKIIIGQKKQPQHKLLRLKAFYCLLFGWWGLEERLSAIHAYYRSAQSHML